MDTVHLPAYAKINLGLVIAGKRPDGYHDLVTIFRRISLHDDLVLQRTKTPGLSLSCNETALAGPDNILHRAWALMQARYDLAGGVSVSLTKRIPTQAGLGGGSADAAAFLTGCAGLFHLPLTAEQLLPIAAELGADVAACLYEGTMLGLGKGEQLTEIKTALSFPLVILKPSAGCPTGAMFSAFDKRNNGDDDAPVRDCVRALQDNNLSALCQRLHNSFESVVDPAILAHKKLLLQNGARAALLSGSGSCVFGIYDNEEAAADAYHALSRSHEAYLCRTLPE